MKLIDKDDVLSLVDDIIADSGYRHTWVATIRRGIADLPEAVVRCRDCIYWDTQDQTVNMIAKCNYYSAERYCVYTNSKDYCSGGERKTDEKPI